jgi:hypothetical protein
MPLLARFVLGAFQIAGSAYPQWLGQTNHPRQRWGRMAQEAVKQAHSGREPVTNADQPMKAILALLLILQIRLLKPFRDISDWIAMNNIWNIPPKGHDSFDELDEIFQI